MGTEAVIIIGILLLVLGVLIGLLIQKSKGSAQPIEPPVQPDFEKIFADVANRGLIEQGKYLSDQQRSMLDDVLKPLKERVKEFEEKVVLGQREAISQHSALMEQIKHLTQLNTQVSQEANNLTRALKGDQQQQGAWGEMILVKVLEASGLREPENYVTQFNTKNENGATIRPDVVVHLPEGKDVVIDSKVSLKAYDEYASIDNVSIEKQSALKRHLNSVNSHIKLLSEKKYETADGLITPDFVLMFIPVEAVFALSLREDQDLFLTAWSKKIILVSPSTLLATLRTVASMWKIEMQNKNAIDIAKRAGQLYDKFVSFADDMKKVGESLDRSRQLHEEAMNKLSSGKGNLVGRVEKLKKLGVNSSKQLPTDLLKLAEDEDEG